MKYSYTIFQKHFGTSGVKKCLQKAIENLIDFEMSWHYKTHLDQESCSDGVRDACCEDSDLDWNLSQGSGDDPVEDRSACVVLQLDVLWEGVFILNQRTFMKILVILF